MHNLRCFAYGHDGSWEALCVDLDISVSGTSLDEVRRELSRVVHDYIDSLKAEDAATRARLFNRRAPLSVQAGLYARVLWAKLFSTRRSLIAFPIAA